VPIEKLKEFYDTFYWPDNATASVIGAIEPAAALALIKKHYGAIPKAPKPVPVVYTEEPEQTAPRRVAVKRAGELGVVAVAHKVPPALHADQPGLTILDNILSAGKNSRFYRALTDKNLTTSVNMDTGSFHDASLGIIYASLAPNVTHEQVEGIVLEELERVKRDGVTDGEVAAAIAQVIAAATYARDGSFSIASVLNEAIAAGDWTFYVTAEDALKKVTPADVQRVAKTYFVEDKRTTGWFIPLPGGGPDGNDEEPATNE
jgi:zinc protease